MKKFLLLIIVVLFSSLPISFAWADSEAEAEAKAKAVIIQDDHSTSISSEKRPLANPVAIGQFALTPLGAKKGAWFQLNPFPFDQEFSMDAIKLMRKKYSFGEVLWGSWLKRHVRFVPQEERLKENSQSIKVLSWNPYKLGLHPGDRKIGEVVFKNKFNNERFGPWPFNSFLTLALGEGKEGSMTSRVFVFARLSEKAVARANLLAAAAAAATTLGSGINADKASGGLAVAPMSGTTSLEIEEIEELRVLCMNDGLIGSPPEPKAEVKAPPPAPAPPAPPKEDVSKIKELEKEKKHLEGELDEMQRRLLEETEKAAKKVEKIESCPSNLLFEIDDYMPNKGKMAGKNYEEAKVMIKWLLDNKDKAKALGGKIAMVGGCDERLIELLKKHDKKYTKAVESLSGGPKSPLATLHPYPTDLDHVNPLLGERRAKMSTLFLGMVAQQMGVLAQIEPILKSIVILSSGKSWLAIPDKPLDDKNRYAILAIVIGGPDTK